MIDLPAATTANRAVEPSAGSATSHLGHDVRHRLRIVCTIDALRSELGSAHEHGLMVGLVPTMGALHEGHLSLIRAARRRCEIVVVSVFINPIQFNERADLLAYPRDEARDAVLAEQVGADLLFVPAPEEIYRPGFATTVEVHGLTDRFEGAIRGACHFRGVTTVVCKLLNIVRPDFAYFGQKDAQQAAVIARMIADLDIEVEIETLPTVREPDGLAMSSRNARLSPAQRERALGLHAALSAAAKLYEGGERSSARLIEVASQTLASHSLQSEYVAIVDRESFEEVELLQRDGLLLLAAAIGETRLIDNQILPAAAETLEQHTPQTDEIQRHQGDVIATCSA